MDVGFNHRGVHPHPPADHNPLVVRYFHQPFVNLLDHLRCHRQAPPAHGLGVRHLAAAHAGEVAVNQIGAHFALENLVAPVTDMLENQQAQDHFGWRPAPTATAALGMSLAQGLINGCDDGLVVQDPVGILHPIVKRVCIPNRPTKSPERKREQKALGFGGRLVLARVEGRVRRPMWMVVRIRPKMAQRKKLAWPLRSSQPLLAVERLVANDGWVASRVKAVSRRGGGRRPAFTGLATQPYSTTEVDG